MISRIPEVLYTPNNSAIAKEERNSEEPSVAEVSSAESILKTSLIGTRLETGQGVRIKELRRRTQEIPASRVMATSSKGTMEVQLGGLRPNYERSPSSREHKTHKTSTRWKYKQSKGDGFRKLKTKN
ncbi:hypothetical protein PC129_g22690 [Phytophthora cactorum]|uniref:Uncharacterized protein n=1 Tax=Phytophthora cactorum TaxID=29920 RepID=A0A329RAI6_9STRA|nr:hypothetical protein Pcac1_g11513 [Phytophthora cactorum]KAG2778205.1 hypothetical protein Pcac1_g11523 [Phytophthora cactorum]KAG2793786.1 hypothetical protein PC111_g22891 [Phytophthora cactorum]KAG2794216.1 hypothetical protein PC112_g23124 [Phytophthora cactorum]KAG2817108.1 hypothetical protein PC113_g23007 [Phytophthora cactorum]